MTEQPIQQGGEQPKGAPQTTDEQRDAVLDQVLEKHGLGADQPPPYEPPGQEPEQDSGGKARDEKGRFKPKSEQQEQPAQEPEEGKAPEQAETPPAPEGEELERALAAIRLDKVPQEVVDTLSTEQRIALGSAIRERRSAHDKALAELAELKKAAQNGAPTKAELESPPQQVDLADALKPFTDEFGEEAGSALKGLFETTVLPQMTEMQQRIEALTQVSGRSFLETQRALLRDSFPGVSDAESWSQVTEKAVQLSKLDGYTDEQAMQDACRLVLGEPRSPEADKEREKAERRELRSRSDGQPSVGITSTPTPPKSKEAKRDAVLDMLLDGAPKDQAAAAFR